MILKVRYNMHQRYQGFLKHDAMKSIWSIVYLMIEVYLSNRHASNRIDFFWKNHKGKCNITVG